MPSDAFVLPDFVVVKAMRLLGGSFVQALAEAFDRADTENRRRLKAAFPELWSEYYELADRHGKRL